MAPEGSNLILPTNVPDVEFDILIGHALDVETDSGNSGDVLVEFQFIQNGFGHRRQQFDRSSVPNGQTHSSFLLRPDPA